MLATSLLGWLFAIIGFAIIIQQQYLKRKARAIQSWPSVEGEVLSSEVIHRSSHDQGSTYRAEVVYEYRVRAQRYKGKNVCLSYDVGTGDRGRAEERCAQYPLGSAVTVYYNAKNPADACLERRADTPIFFIILAAAFLFFGWGIILDLIQF